MIPIRWDCSQRLEFKLPIIGLNQHQEAATEQQVVARSGLRNVKYCLGDTTVVMSE